MPRTAKPLPSQTITPDTRSTYPDGRWIPVLGDRVVRASGTNLIRGTVEKAPKGHYSPLRIMEDTGRDSYTYGNRVYYGNRSTRRRAEPFSDTWSVVGCPAGEAREARRVFEATEKEREAREQREAEQRQYEAERRARRDADIAWLRESIVAAYAVGHAPYDDATIKPGHIIHKYYEADRAVTRWLVTSPGLAAQLGPDGMPVDTKRSATAGFYRDSATVEANPVLGGPSLGCLINLKSFGRALTHIGLKAIVSVHLEAGPDGSAVVIHADTDKGPRSIVRPFAGCKVNQPGRVTLNAPIMARIAAVCPDEEIGLTLDPNQPGTLIVRGSHAEWRLNTPGLPATAAQPWRQTPGAIVHELGDGNRYPNPIKSAEWPEDGYVVPMVAENAPSMPQDATTAGDGPEVEPTGIEPTTATPDPAPRVFGTINVVPDEPEGETPADACARYLSEWRTSHPKRHRAKRDIAAVDPTANLTMILSPAGSPAYQIDTENVPETTPVPRWVGPLALPMPRPMLSLPKPAPVSVPAPCCSPSESAPCAACLTSPLHGDAEPGGPEVFEDHPLPSRIFGTGAESVPIPVAPVSAPVALLSLTIGDRSYGLAILTAPDGSTVYRLDYRDKVYDVTPDGASLTGATCDCPDFTYRRAGLDSAGCRHIKALRSVGLLAPVPVPPKDGGGNDPDRAPDFSEPSTIAPTPVLSPILSLALMGFPICGGSPEADDPRLEVLQDAAQDEAEAGASRMLAENGDDSTGWAECWIDEGDGPNSPDTAPIIGGTDGRDFRCRACAKPDDSPVHGDSDPDCHPPTCKECGAVMVPEGAHAPDPLLYAILRADLPSVRNPDLRKERRTVWAKAIRRLLADLGIKGVSITTPHYSMAHSIDVKLPAGTPHDRGAADHEYRDCPMCQERNRAQDRITQIILAAFPDLDDRSDSMTDYFDFCLSVD
jgi:hypothetical protein